MGWGDVVSFQIGDPFDEEAETQRHRVIAYRNDLEIATGILVAAKDYLEDNPPSRWRTLIRMISTPARRVWSEFKSLPPLQLKIIVGAIVIIALLAAGFTIRQIVDLIRALKKGE